MYKEKDGYRVPLYCYPVEKTEKINGVTKKIYTKEPFLFFGSFKSYGGTDVETNGILSVEDTATVKTWFRPDITSDCKIALAEQPRKQYEIMGEPEDIEQRHKYLSFKVKRIKGAR